MDAFNPRVFDLVHKLDALGGNPTLAGIARTLEDVALKSDDVREYVRGDQQTYHRARVVLREHYELLVMTWLPGQQSLPHDHTGSVCALQVIQGEAVEASYGVADDGYVDLEYESVVRPGEVSAGQDAGIHNLRNAAASGDPLVTVHVYAPPLRDFRRFVPRPTNTTARLHTDRVPTVVVVGGGFSGAMTAAQILRQTGAKVRVALIERRGSIADGLAYSTSERVHLLNVPAARMSAWPDRPEDFLRWAGRRSGEVKPGDFLPRQSYGEYIRETLFDSARAAAPTGELLIVLDEVRRVARHPAGGWMVHLDRGSSLRAAAVVLAIGHRPPSDPIARVWSGPRDRFIGDPWRPYAVHQVGAAESAVILGTGLTAIDAVLSLSHQPRTAPITLVSRNGLLPQAHARAPVAGTDMGPFVKDCLTEEGGLTARGLFGRLKRLVRQKTAEGVDWRSVVDGLRPHTATVWRAFSSHERGKFLKRLRPIWEIHRHRMASSIADRLHRMIECSEVRIVRGRVVSVAANAHGVRLAIRAKGSDRVMESHFDWVINCTGPVPSNSAEANPVIGTLLVHDLVRADDLMLGIDTTAEGNAVDARGQKVADLFVVGTLRKPALWESTAVPELREQAAQVAKHVLNYVCNSGEPVAMHI